MGMEWEKKIHARVNAKKKIRAKKKIKKKFMPKESPIVTYLTLHKMTDIR